MKKIISLAPKSKHPTSTNDELSEPLVAYATKWLANPLGHWDLLDLKLKVHCIYREWFEH